MNPRSVLMVTPRWMRNGGVGTHIQASAGALAAAGIDVSVLAAKVDAKTDIPGVRVHQSPRLFEGRATMSERFAGSLDRSPEVIHIHQVDDPSIVRFAREHAPVLISVHGYTACASGVHYFKPGEECDRAHGPGCWANLSARGCGHTRRPERLPAAYKRATQQLRAIKDADLAVCYSSAIERHLTVNAVQRQAMVPLFSTVPAKTGVGHRTRRRVVFAGRVVTPKGVGVLIRAARMVQAEFVICGDGWNLESSRRLARRLRVEQRVHFRGWLDAHHTAEEFANASIVVVPSLWPEPFGLVGIEAFAAGRPVVASATGGIKDWLEDGVNGLLVRPGDVNDLARALEELLSDPARQERMGQAGRELVSARFSAQAHIDALRDAYQSASAHWLRRGRPG